MGWRARWPSCAMASPLELLQREFRHVSPGRRARALRHIPPLSARAPRSSPFFSTHRPRPSTSVRMSYTIPELPEEGRVVGASGKGKGVPEGLAAPSSACSERRRHMRRGAEREKIV